MVDIQTLTAILMFLFGLGFFLGGCHPDMPGSCIFYEPVHAHIVKASWGFQQVRISYHLTANCSCATIERFGSKNRDARLLRRENLKLKIKNNETELVAVSRSDCSTCEAISTSKDITIVGIVFMTVGGLLIILFVGFYISEQIDDQSDRNAIHLSDFRSSV